MEYARLGATGLEVSRLCLGCMSFSALGQAWRLNESDSRPIIKQALDLGINFFDTANSYADGTSEEVIGRAIKKYTKRDDVILATKICDRVRPGPNGEGLSRKAIFREIDASLTRLGTDYIDLYQIHRWDYGTPIEETLEALHDVVKSGKARYIGASSMHAWQFAKALYTSRQHGWSQFASMQNHVNLLYREEEREMLPLCLDQKIAVIPWSPLARGRLTRNQGETSARQNVDEYGRKLYQQAVESDRKTVEAVKTVAEARGVPKAQVALAWVMQKAGVVAPIVGATKPAHLTDAVTALSLKLTKEEIAALEAHYVPRGIVGFQ